MSVDVTAWRGRLRELVLRRRRRNYSMSGLALLMGGFFGVLFAGPEVPGPAHAFFAAARGQWPILIPAIAMLALACGGVVFAASHGTLVLDALVAGEPVPVRVRFVDLGRDETVPYEAWFDAADNASLQETVMGSIWMRSKGCSPPTGRTVDGLALLDARGQTPIAVTVGECTYILGHPAQKPL